MPKETARRKQNKTRTDAAAPIPDSERAQINLAQATQRVETATEQHITGLFALFEMLTAEGLLKHPQAFRSGPLTRETTRAWDASDAKWEEVQALQVERQNIIIANSLWGL